MKLSLTRRDDWGISWIAAEPAYMQRASHALAVGDEVWLVDPVDGEGLDALVAPLGTVRGVLQLIDRHPRDAAALAERYGVPLLRLPRAAVPGAPFSPICVADRRWWREVALWWPEHRALVVAEALGTVPYFLAPGAIVGVHPMLRLWPPRVLDGHGPLHLLPCHGAPISGPQVAPAIGEALRRSRRDLPRTLRSMLRSGRHHDAKML